MKLTKI
jgi:hypothetical protein